MAGGTNRWKYKSASSARSLNCAGLRTGPMMASTLLPEAPEGSFSAALRSVGCKKVADFVKVLRPPSEPQTGLALGASALAEGLPFGGLGAE
eukprot:3012724-Alexandrium_andersonii.AAC.1